MRNELAASEQKSEKDDPPTSHPSLERRGEREKEKAASILSGKKRVPSETWV
jgi:hypothetical protein